MQVHTIGPVRAPAAVELQARSISWAGGVKGDLSFSFVRFSFVYVYN